MSTQTAVYQSDEMELLGRQVAAHIRHHNQYGKKAKQHKISAAQCLRQARDAIEYGDWYPWLVKHGIKPRTANRLLMLADNPEKYEAQAETQRQADEDKRRAAGVPEGTRRSVKSASVADSATANARKELSPLEVERRKVMNCIRKLQDIDTLKEILAILAD